MSLHRRLRSATALAVAASILTGSVASAEKKVTAKIGGLDKDKARYMGGTVPEFKDHEEPVEGYLVVDDARALEFAYLSKRGSGKTEIPWKRITSLEYGQKAGRRVGAAVGTTILLGPLGLVSLFSKKRRHYLTIGYKDAGGTDQAAIFELGKDIVRETLTVVKTRSGQDIEYQDDEARKSGLGD